MKLSLIFLLLFELVPASNFLDQREEVKENNVEAFQEVEREETLGTYRENSKVSKDIFQKEKGAFGIPAGNAGYSRPQAIGIPAGKKSSKNWKYIFLLSLPFSALAGWLVFRKRYSTKSTTGPTTIPEFYQKIRQEDSGEDLRDTASTCEVKDNEEDKHITRIKEFMVTEQPFLDPEFTIKTMADQLDMEVRELSLLLNNSFQQNFYDFLNLYRIEKAKELLKDPINKKLTILEILYSVGFNSKSSFNTSFKKLSGLTPTQYRQKFNK